MEEKTFLMQKHPETSKKTGGLIINEKDAGNAKLLVEVIKNLSKKLIKLDVLDIFKFSRPAKLTYPLTLHQCTANELIRTDLLEKAYNCKNDPIERMKYVCAFLIGGVHTGPLDCKSRAPFNPILGETYQAINEADGSKIFIEQTEHHPPTLNFNLIGPNKHFEITGFGAVEASLVSINIIKGTRGGKNILIFYDEDEKGNKKLSKFTFTNLRTKISGVIMGDRIYDCYDDLIIKDYTNKVECILSFKEVEEQGMLSKLIYGKQKHQSDEAEIEIKQVNPETKQKDLKCKGIASWLGQCVFNNKVYWSIFDDKSKWVQKGINYLLPSDSTYRTDLNALIANNLNEAQVQKDYLENIQRHDQKLREENLKKI